MTQDLRYAARALRNNPAFSLVVILTLSLGIGINAAIFSMFDRLALQPLTLPNGKPLVAMYQDVSGVSRSMHGGRSLFSYSEYTDYRDHNESFSGLAAYMPDIPVVLDDVVRGQLTSCNYFEVLGSPPVIGRGFLQSECASDDAGPVVVLSSDLWRTHFNSDPAILGKQVKLNRVTLTVVGIAARGFGGTELQRAAFWAPVSMERALVGGDQSSYLQDPHMAWLAIVGDLRNGVTIAQARTNLRLIASRIDAAQPKRRTTLTVANPSLLGDPEKFDVALGAGVALLAAVGLVLLIACTNVANLFLARALARRREIAIRLAIGASRRRLVRQLLTEGLLLAVVSGVVGTTVAVWAAATIGHATAGSLSLSPVATQVKPDARLVAYAVFLIALTTVVFSLLPALQATRVDVQQTLKTDNLTSGRTGSRLSGALVGGQVATCTLLLIAAGLFLRGLAHAATLEPGWAIDEAVGLSINFAREGYSTERAAALIRDLGARLQSTAGVDAVTEANTSPLGESHNLTGFGPPGQEVGRSTEFTMATSNYFATTGTPLVRGRDFTAADATAGKLVAVVNESAAKSFWPGQDPIGKILRRYPNKDYEIVGVARDVQISRPGRQHAPYVYIEYEPSDALEVHSIIVRSRAPYASVASAMRTAALSFDPALHVTVAPLRDNLHPYILASRVLAILSSILGALALLLAAIGVFGTVAFSVAQRTREIGIRFALGARASAITRLVLGQALRPVAIGALIGLVLCGVSSPFLAPILFGISAHDLIAFTGVPSVLLIVAGVASYLPARRALRVDPVETLRHL